MQKISKKNTNFFYGFQISEKYMSNYSQISEKITNFTHPPSTARWQVFALGPTPGSPSVTPTQVFVLAAPVTKPRRWDRTMRAAALSIPAASEHDRTATKAVVAGQENMRLLVSNSKKEPIPFRSKCVFLTC
jgi:hypothetical protein